ISSGWRRGSPYFGRPRGFENFQKTKRNPRRFDASTCEDFQRLLSTSDNSVGTEPGTGKGPTMRDGKGFQLTALKVARITRPGRYGDGSGLYLRIAEYPRQDGTRARSKNWVFRFERDGRERWMGLGALRDVTLAQARALVRDCRLMLVQGLDPIAARQAKRRG